MIPSLLLVTGPPDTRPHDVAHAVAARMERAVHVDVEALRQVVVTGAEPESGSVSEGPGGLPSPAAVEQLFLRWLAGISVAETYQRGGYDALLSDHVTGVVLDDLLDIIDPTPVHLVLLRGDGELPAPDGPGLLLDGRSPTDELAAAVLERLEEALVRPGAGPGDSIRVGGDGA